MYTEINQHLFFCKPAFDRTLKHLIYKVMLNDAKVIIQ